MLSMGIEQVTLSLDVVTFALREMALDVLLMQRAEDPFAGVWALPGGVVAKGERLDDAARRVLHERTGVTSDYLEQLYTFGDPDRDPRGRTISVAYYTLLAPGEHPARAGRGTMGAAWYPIAGLPALAFDHGEILAYARQRLMQKVTYAPLAFQALPEAFTMGDLRAVHESILGETLHPSNFVRQMLARWDLAPVPGPRDRRTRRPARLYRYIGPRDIPGPPPSEARSQSDPTAAPGRTATASI